MIIAPLLLAVLLAAPVELEGVPFVKQGRGWCGPAALESVFAYYHMRIAQEEIAKATYCDMLQGALITDLDNYAKSKGFKTILRSGTPDDIKQMIAERKPVIAIVDMGFWRIHEQHYLVVFGYTDTGFIAHTGYEARVPIPYAKFSRYWKKMGAVFLVPYR